MQKYNLGQANALKDAMILEGMSEDEARAQFWVVDADGVLAENRPITFDQAQFVRHPTSSTLSVLQPASLAQMRPEHHAGWHFLATVDFPSQV
jgi:hypothetical protein